MPKLLYIPTSRFVTWDYKDNQDYDSTFISHQEIEDIFALIDDNSREINNNFWLDYFGITKPIHREEFEIINE